VSFANLTKPLGASLQSSMHATCVVRCATGRLTGPVHELEVAEGIKGRTGGASGGKRKSSRTSRAQLMVLPICQSMQGWFLVDIYAQDR
jgi:hypothetical protein